MRISYLIASLAALIALITSCGDPVDRQIDDLIAGGEKGESAKISLNLAKGTAIVPLIEALRNREHPVRARVDLVDALYRLHLREKSAAAFAGLVEGLEDPEPRIRAAIAQAVGNIGERKATSHLLATLEKETHPTVQLEILKTFEMMSLETITGSNPTIDLGIVIGEDQVPRFTQALQTIDSASDSLEAAKQEWLENIAETMALQARKSVLTGHLDEAEQGLKDALALVPDSHNINFQLGKFYYQNGRTEEGLDIVARVGLLAEVKLLSQAPTLDGDLDDPAWETAAPLTDFYQLLQRMNTYPAVGQSEVYLGYIDQMLYIGVKGYEPRTDNLRAEATQRDAGDVWRDDCIEIYIDTNHDSRTYYQLIINNIGTLEDRHNSGSGSGPELDWNARLEAETLITEDFWSMELAVPIADFHNTRVEPGDVWGFNIAQVRIANSSESAQWAPTYGWSQQPDRFGFLVFK